MMNLAGVIEPLAIWRPLLDNMKFRNIEAILESDWPAFEKAILPRIREFDDASPSDLLASPDNRELLNVWEAHERDSLKLWLEQQLGLLPHLSLALLARYDFGSDDLERNTVRYEILAYTVSPALMEKALTAHFGSALADENVETSAGLSVRPISN